MGEKRECPLSGQAKLANSNELLERSILRTQQQDDHAHVEPHGKKVAWCPGGCGRTVGCASSRLGYRGA